MGRQENQAGVALFTALIFLIIITLISLSAMRSTTLELKMAKNEQSHNEALQSAQSAIDGTLEILTPADLMQLTGTGDVLCINDTTSPECDISGYTLGGDAFGASTNTLQIQLLNPSMPPPRSIESSGSQFETVLFSINSRYDGTDTGGGRADISQGYLMLVPDSTN